MLLVSVPVYIPTAMSNWQPAPSLPFKDMGQQGGVWNGKLYTAGGFTGSSITHAVLEYLPASGKWSQVSTVPTAAGVGSDDSGSAVLDGVLYIVGGIWSAPSGIRNVSTMVAWDIKSGSRGWSTKAPMLTPRRGFPVAADAASGGTLYATGGINCRRDCCAPLPSV